MRKTWLEEEIEGEKGLGGWGIFGVWDDLKDPICLSLTYKGEARERKLGKKARKKLMVNRAGTMGPQKVDYHANPFPFSIHFTCIHLSFSRGSGRATTQPPKGKEEKGRIKLTQSTQMFWRLGKILID
ncbi:Uncharacterized protein TCM_016951 [Theobroma cacao]|uniref:Uncharacterized protein n=1 Tax=Theobroma cacao TaxID=3641 RepID=A0A061ECW0_THECC|nr:Uncharacterized protein TCM_016951 [Theobroma cacao]